MTKLNAILVDTDGTVANHKNVRSPYDTSRYHLDEPYSDVIQVVRALARWYAIIGLSGRYEEHRETTEAWWLSHVGFVPENFFMRPTGDHRPDDVVKAEIYDQHIADDYRVIGVIDDRPRVCRMWREKGLTTFQVGDPHMEF